MKILLVEDSATLRHAMSQYIIEAGHTPLLVDSGEAALQLLEDTPVDMIIMDVEMPGLNGFETTALIREWLGDHWIPIIFVTGMSDDEDYRQGIEAGGDDYLIKPVSKMIINAKIRAMERIADMRDQLNKLNQELATLSQLDSLTQLLNRRTFNEFAEKQWLLAGRQLTHTCLLMLDVDHFKLYNDHYGHPAGDRCLIAIGNAIKNCLKRPYDLIGRYGGEEFIILLPDTDSCGAARVAESIRTEIQQLAVPHEISPTSAHVTISIGGASCSHTNGYSLEDLTRAADRALYRAKNLGRDCFEIDEMSAHRTVVIAHPDAEIQHQAGKVLQPYYNLITADSTEEALELSQNIRPDLIVLSPLMSDKKGRTLTERLAQAPRCRATPLLFILTDQSGIDTPPGTTSLSLPSELAQLPVLAGRLIDG